MANYTLYCARMTAQIKKDEYAVHSFLMIDSHPVRWQQLLSKISLIFFLQMAHCRLTEKQSLLKLHIRILLYLSSGTSNP